MRRLLHFQNQLPQRTWWIGNIFFHLVKTISKSVVSNKGVVVSCCHQKPQQISPPSFSFLQPESRVMTWHQWKGRYSLIGLEKKTIYSLEICKYASQKAHNKCEKARVATSLSWTSLLWTVFAGCEIISNQNDKPAENFFLNCAKNVLPTIHKCICEWPVSPPWAPPSLTLHRKVGNGADALWCAQTELWKCLFYDHLQSQQTIVFNLQTATSIQDWRKQDCFWQKIVSLTRNCELGEQWQQHAWKLGKECNFVKISKGKVRLANQNIFMASSHSRELNPVGNTKGTPLVFKNNGWTRNWTFAQKPEILFEQKQEKNVDISCCIKKCKQLSHIGTFLFKKKRRYKNEKISQDDWSLARKMLFSRK